MRFGRFLRATHQTTSALLTDLCQRGLFDDTLILFGSELGACPCRGVPIGRNHNIPGYSMFLTGGHKQLTYRYAGRPLRLTDVAGEVHSQIFA